MDKAIGLDLGKKTLGIATSDSLGFAHPLETFRFPSFQFELAVNRVLEVSKEKGITNIALGYPLHLSGQPSEMSENVLNFKKMLESANPNFKIELVDERLTSVQANNTLSFLDVSHQKRKDNVDSLAAQEYLNHILEVSSINKEIFYGRN